LGADFVVAPQSYATGSGDVIDWYHKKNASLRSPLNEFFIFSIQKTKKHNLFFTEQAFNVKINSFSLIV